MSRGADDTGAFTANVGPFSLCLYRVRALVLRPVFRSVRSSEANATTEELHMNLKMVTVAECDGRSGVRVVLVDVEGTT